MHKSVGGLSAATAAEARIGAATKPLVANVAQVSDASMHTFAERATTHASGDADENSG
jgi:hypothetical protein